MTDKSLLKALFDFQGSVSVILKDKENPFYKSNYADIPAVWVAIKDLIQEHGLYVGNSISLIDGRDTLTTRISHVDSGEYIESSLPLNAPKKDHQGYGAAITYHRRQNLTSMLNLICDDDDGQSGYETPQEKAKREREAAEFQAQLKEKREKANAWASKAETDMLSFNTPEELKSWFAKQSNVLASLSKYEDITTNFNTAYGKRLNEVSQAPIGDK